MLLQIRLVAGDKIFLFHLVAGMHQPLGEVAVVGEDDQALQVRPKMIQPNGKGMFMLSLIANYPNQVLTSTSIT